MPPAKKATAKKATAKKAPAKKTTRKRTSTTRNTSAPNWTVLVAIVGVVAIVIALLIAKPWDSDDNSPTAGPKPTPTTVAPTPSTSDSTTSTTDASNSGADNTSDDVDTGSLPDPTSESKQGSWNVKLYGSGNEGDQGQVQHLLSTLMEPAPAKWKTFPNVPNPDEPGFRVVNGNEVPDGVEYGVPNVPFCQQDTRCDFIVPAWHYRLITADYGFQGMTCKGEDGHGCLLLLFNLNGDASQTWRNQMADNGFTVPGRFFNGDALEWAVQGLVSHASANMLNMPTLAHPGEVLNAGPEGTNAGANCGNVKACPEVQATVVVHSGDQILAVLQTTVRRP